MKTLKACVKKGRLVLDVPTTFPEGTVIELTMADPGDDLDPEEREALHASLEKSWKQAQAGETLPASKLFARLRRRRKQSAPPVDLTDHPSFGAWEHDPDGEDTDTLSRRIRARANRRSE